ncbi:hypothetical protein ACIRS1_37120 [Kitasatospora sp. NPDC101176]|uniref:hypothetical protein n=1 Tax=Kitasatospora sp. NPDC101176 TaxID=3364099 RepID=UPI003813F1F0
MTLLAAPAIVLQPAMTALKTVKWDDFYAGWIKPLGQVVIAAGIVLVVLVVVTGLLTRLMVERRAESWGDSAIWVWTAVGATALLAVAVFLPVYPMFIPFDDATWATFAFPLAVVLPGVLLILLASGFRPGLHRSGWWVTRIMPPATATVLLLLWAGLLSCFLSWGETDRLVVADLGLALLGLSATSTALGQNLRLQVQAQSGKGEADAAATDYVLASLQHLGTVPIDDFGVSRATELSKLMSEDLSAIPAGNVAAAAAKIMYAIRPGLTWRARITLVDDDRVTVTLTRNSLQAFSTVVSRPELGLPPIAAKRSEPRLTQEKDRARAQLLTGAAAYVLVCLSKSHPRLRRGLCGAVHGKTVALHVIATQPVLLPEPELRTKLLKRAVDLEPEYGPARIEYVTALFDEAPPTTANRFRFVRLLEQVRVLAEADGKVKQGWETVYVRSLYGEIAMRVNGYLTEQVAGPARLAALRRREGDVLGAALARADVLETACDELAGRKDNHRLRAYLDDTKRSSANMRLVIALLREGRCPAGTCASLVRMPEPVASPSPELAYEYACVAAMAREFDRLPGPMGELERHLMLAVATQAEKRSLWSDPSFATLLRDPVRAAESRRALALEPPVGMLDLAPFFPYRDKLRAVGATRFAEFSARVADGSGRDAMAVHLDASPLVVSHLAAIARLGAVHRDLDQPEVVAVLLAAGIAGPDELRRRAVTADDRDRLKSDLADLAERKGVLGLPAFTRPDDWLSAL